MKSLQERAKDLTILLPFMENRTKGDTKDLMNVNVTINQFGFLHDNTDGVDKEYACFTVQGDNEKFYFGGQVLTENLQLFENEGYRKEIEEKGLPVMFTTKKSKSKRDYTAVTFYPVINK